MPIPTKPSKESEGSALAVALSVGWELASFSVLGVGLGYWFDGHFKSSPWGTLVGALFGIVIGLYRLIRTFSISKNGASRGR
jgi:F0F1-type ATP synthase assembly protein I